MRPTCYKQPSYKSYSSVRCGRHYAVRTVCSTRATQQKPPAKPSRAVVLGGGIGGLMAAQVLSHRVNEVVLLDRDHQVLPLTETVVEAAKVRWRSSHVSHPNSDYTPLQVLFRSS